MKFGVGELQRRTVFGFPHQRGLIGVFLEMAVETVVRDVELAADEPFGVRWIPLQSFLGRFGPLDELGLLGPVGFGVHFGCFVEFAVFLHRANVGFLAKFFRRRNGFFVEYVGIKFLHEASVWPGMYEFDWRASRKCGGGTAEGRSNKASSAPPPVFKGGGVGE